jgi:hypothetical protein
MFVENFAIEFEYLLNHNQAQLKRYTVDELFAVKKAHDRCPTE